MVAVCHRGKFLNNLINSSFVLYKLNKYTFVVRFQMYYSDGYQRDDEDNDEEEYY